MVLCGSGAVGALVQGVFSRRRVQSDAAAILSDASARMLEDIQEDMEKINKRLRDYEQQRWVHQKWDAARVAQLQQLGVDVEPPPELWL